MDKIKALLQQKPITVGHYDPVYLNLDTTATTTPLTPQASLPTTTTTQNTKDNLMEKAITASASASGLASASKTPKHIINKIDDNLINREQVLQKINAHLQIKNSTATAPLTTTTKAQGIETTKEQQPSQVVDTIMNTEIVGRIPPSKTMKREKMMPEITRGMAEIGDEINLKIGDTPIGERMPKKANKIIIKADSYYMNNREKFIQFIKILFDPYKKELENMDATSSTTTKTELLLHQKVVRDYINLYTPYRGVLLYHSLGSGKTASSIAIAEGMKEAKRIIVMTTASTRSNYIKELKQYGDELYRLNQYWEWIPLTNEYGTRQQTAQILAQVLNLPLEYIVRQNGGWLINVKKPANYVLLTADQKAEINRQIDKMIDMKYLFISYNGLRYSKLQELTNNFTVNIFDNAVVVIDEVHNLISRIVNKIKYDPAFYKDWTGTGTGTGATSIDARPPPKFISTRLYEDLLNANNAKLVFLSGTPIINYPNEFAILFNMLRGYIKTWNMKINVKTSEKIDLQTLKRYLETDKTMDYLNYSPSNRTIILTRNPFGFHNTYKINTDTYNGVALSSSSFTSDAEFEANIIQILKEKRIEIVPDSIQIIKYKALPDNFDTFCNKYINPINKDIINTNAMKRRIIGLSSYFNTIQTDLLPEFKKILGKDYHIVRVKMSEFQFGIYEKIRSVERTQEKQLKKNNKNRGNGAAGDLQDIYENTNSTYRIYSRLFCNYVLPNRPMPSHAEKQENIKKQHQKNIAATPAKGGADAVSSALSPPHKKTVVNLTKKKLSGLKTNKTRKNKSGDLAGDELVDNPTNQPVDEPTKELPTDQLMDEPMKELQTNQPIDEPTKELPTDQPMDEPTKELPTDQHQQDIIKEYNKPQPLQQVNENDLNEFNDQHDPEFDKENEQETDAILDEEGGELYKQQIENALKMLENNPKEYLTPIALKTYSPKFLAILENIQDEDHKGLHLVYSQFRTLEGLGIFSLVLKANGFTQFKLFRNKSTGQWEINIDEIREKGQFTFTLFSGTETKDEKEILRNIYNSKWDLIPNNIATELKTIANDNFYGQIIKILMITSSGAEGIDLKNTRYVHVMEPYWHPVRIEQVIGRAVRFKSHLDLPKELRNVEVFIYLMVFTEEQLNSDKSIELKLYDKGPLNPNGPPVTTDQYLYEVSEIKANLTKQLTEMMKETAFDCYIYGQSKCMNFNNPSPDDFAYVPDYALQESDKVIGMNQKKIEWKAIKIEIGSQEYAARKINNDEYEIYDLKSYQLNNPIQIGTLKKNNGKLIFITSV